VPAKVRFASFEPLLCPIPKINFSGIQWAIVGGESGPKARPMDLDWARDIREQCQRARIPFFFKQVGGKGRDKGGRLLDGQEFNEFPIEAVMARSSDEEPKSETGLSSERDTDEEQSEKYVEIDPAIMYFDRENPVPEQKKIRIKEMNEMPRKSQSKASNEQDTMKKNSHEVQPTLPSKKEHAAPTQSDGGVSMVDESKLKDILDELRQRKTIKNDKGEEIDFTEDLKTSLEKDVQKAYPVLTSALRNIYETGKFFYEVRARQKKNHLWMSFHEIIGMRKSATNNYIRVFDRFGTRLGEVGYLGVSKLQVLARLKDPFAFLEAHRDEVEKGEVRSVTSMVRDEVEAQRQKRDKKSKREPQAVDVGSYRIKLATNGRVLTIQNLNKDLQNKLVEHLKKLLSHEK